MSLAITVDVLCPFMLIDSNNISLLQEYMNVICSLYIWYEIKVAFGGMEKSARFGVFLIFPPFTSP